MNEDFKMTSDKNLKISIMLLYNKIYRKKDYGLVNKGIYKNINEETNEIYSAKKIGNIIENNLKDKNYKKIYYILKKKNIIMDIIEKKIEKKIFTLVKKNYKNKSELNTSFKQYNTNNFTKHNINNWYNLIGSNRIYSIPSGLILIITGRMLKLKKASRTKSYRLLLGNIKSKNYDENHRTIIDKNGSIGIKLKIHSNYCLKSKN